MGYKNYNQFHNFDAPKPFLVIRGVYQHIMHPEIHSIKEQLDHTIYPLKKTWRNRHKRHHYYRSFGEFLKDVLQPLYGLGNITYGLLQWFLTSLLVLSAAAISLFTGTLLLACIIAHLIVPSHSKSKLINSLLKVWYLLTASFLQQCLLSL